MKQTLSTLEAADILFRDENAAWSYAGAYALVEYLEQYEQDTGEELEFDPIAIRCDFSEYESAIEAVRSYTDSIKTEKEALEYLEDRTSVISFEGGIIIIDF